MSDKKPQTEAEFLSQTGGYLALHGAKLIQQGYTVVPIAVGKKAPGFDNWQRAKASSAQVKTWVEKDGYRWSGVGILTKNTPAIDIDVRDAEVADLVEAWIRENIGDAPKRIGRAPKRLFVFRTDEPFRKLRSTKYQDEWAEDQQIEILGDGQQFVSYHKHPDTGKPYTWPDDTNPLNTRAADLITITMEQILALIEYFESLAVERGWKVIKGKRLQSQMLDEDNPWVEDSSPILIDDDELRSRLMLVPHPEDHDEWVNVGMALFHQYDGEDLGLELWNEWAETADNYDADELDRRWKSFSINGKKRAPITARYILRVAAEALEDAAVKLGMELELDFQQVKDQKGWEAVRKKTREAEIDALARSRLAQAAKAALDRVTQSRTPLAEIKKAISYLPKKMEKTPEWATGWVYDTSVDRFFSTEKKISTTKQGFDAMYDRKALSKKDILDGRTSPSSSASEVALNVYKIPVVNGQRYLPGEDDIVHYDEGIFANTYPEHEIPDLPEKMTPRDKKAIARVQAHLEHLLADEDERRSFTDWLAWVVQNPGEHARYGVLLQGVQGDGKTFFAEMMRKVMGVSNVTMLNAHIFHSNFTNWAEGQCLACVEEVRLVDDKNKYEVLNRIKPYITNNINEIEPKGEPIRNVKNTTNYLLFSNYKDALPINDNDRRYQVFFSRWQNREKLLAFKDEHPTYYQDLYDCIEECAPALRHWLLNHELHEDFNPMGDAPDTKARQQMIRRSKPAFILQLDEVIADGMYEFVTDRILSIKQLDAAFNLQDYDMPMTKSLSTMLDREGYDFLGRCWLPDGDRHYLWTRYPEEFRNDDEVVSRKRLTKYWEERKRVLDNEEI